MTKKIKDRPSVDLSKEIMAEIKSGQIQMKPRVYFIIGSILTGLGIASSLFAALITITLTLFRLRRFGLTGLLWTGKPLLAPIPLIILIGSLIFLWIGLKLIKHYEFAYKHNFIAIIIAITFIIVTLGFLFDNFGGNQILERNSNLRPFYQQHQPGFSPSSQRGRMIRGQRQF